MSKETAQNTIKTAGGRWWDKLEKPQYGGEMVFRTTRNPVNWDPYYAELLPQIYTAWMSH